MIDFASILASPKTDAKIKELAAEVQLADDKLPIVKEIILSYLKGEILGEKISIDLEKKAGMEFSPAVKLAWDILEQVVEPLPLELKAYIVEEVIPATQDEKVKEVNLDQLIADLKEETDISVEPKYEKRLADIIFGWFRGIQDDPETIDKLTRSNKIGGVQLLYDEASNLVAALNKKKEEFGDSILKAINKTQLISSEGPQPVDDQEIDVSAKPRPQIDLNEISAQEPTIEELLAQKGMRYDDLIKKAYTSADTPKTAPEAEEKEFVNPVLEEIEAEEEFLEATPELEAPEILPIAEKIETPSPTPVKSKAQAASEDILEELGLPMYVPAWKQQQKAAQAPEPKVTTQPQKINSDQNSTLSRKQESNDRPRVEDVRGRGPRLYGPIEELASLTLIDFRRLSKDPAKAASIISQKLEILENDSLEKRAAGIKALKASPLYKIYADIMNKAFNTSQAYSQIIAQRGDITMEEYQAIMGLNKSLKY